MVEADLVAETFDVSRAIAEWRIAVLADGRLSEEQIAELEDHLVCSLDQFDDTRMTGEERFLVATRRLGQPSQLHDEFVKVVPWASWKGPVFWAAVAIAWVMGIESIVEVGVLTGALFIAKASLGPFWMSAWASAVCVGGPAAALWSVATWMRRYSATHPSSQTAVLATVAAALLCRATSLPLLGILHTAVWASLPARAAGTFRRTWEVSVWAGLFLVAGAAALVVLRSPEGRGLKWR